MTSFPGSTAKLLPGPRTHAQAKGLDPLWQALAVELRDLEGMGVDVLVDAGRLGTVGFPEPLLAAADVVVLVVRSDLVSLAGAREWADTLRESEATGGPVARLLVVGEGRPYSAGELGKALGLPVLASTAWDEKAATVFSHGRAHRGLDSSALVRSLRTVASALGARDRVSTASVPAAGVA